MQQEQGTEPGLQAFITGKAGRGEGGAKLLRKPFSLDLHPFHQLMFCLLFTFLPSETLK